MELSAPQIRSLIRISACVALRDEDQLRRELKRSLKTISLEIIREAILQTYLFAGYAATINAFILLNEVGAHSCAALQDNFLRESEASLELWRYRGESLCRRIYDDQYEKLVRNMNSLHPDLADWMLWEGYGKVLSRPFLSLRVRELLIVAMTAVLGVKRQFHSHVRGAIHVGATARELRDVLRLVSPYLKKKDHKIFEDLLDELC